MPLRNLQEPDHLPALNRAFALQRPALGLGPDDPAPRILLLYGSLRERSFSRLCVEEAARLLQFFGCETRIFRSRHPAAARSGDGATITRPSTNCASCRCGRKGMCGAAPSGTARLPAS